jgi:putative DNA primase/helicase
MTGDDRIHQAWSSSAKELASWAWRYLVNRTDVWGGYNALADRDNTYTAADGQVKKLGPTTTRPPIKRRGQLLLTEDTLRWHFRANAPESVVGLHTTSPENMSKWGAIEVDYHDENSPSADVNVAAALAWYNRLCELGFHPLLTDSNGNGGYHLRVIFDRRVPTPIVHSFLLWLVKDHKEHGLKRPEVFPKQPKIQSGMYGNWLRTPGRHHTREHWSEVWQDYEGWLSGEQAIQAILKITGDSPGLIPKEAGSYVEPAPVPRRMFCPPIQASDPLSRRIRNYIAKMPTGLREGTGRDNYAYQLAAFLTRDLALDDNAALPWLSEWDNRQSVPKGEKRLAEICKNARLYGRHAFGSGLPQY